MFRSFGQRSNNSNANTSTSMDNTVDSFVQVMDIDGVEEKALTTKITARNDVIGLGVAQNTTEFCITTEAITLPEDDESIRAPVDIVVALDVSGSMRGKKLELCKQTLSFLLRELTSRDRFGLITFGDQATLGFPTMEMTKKNKASALKKIKDLVTNGCTNMSGGIELAANELRTVASPHDVRSIFLLTDGRANRGVNDNDGIVELTKRCLGGEGRQNQIAIHCFGYGSDHNQDMLNEISQATEGGTYYFVEQDCDVASAFGDALGGILSVVAQNVSINIKVPTEGSDLGVSILNVRHDKAVAQEDGSYRVDIGDFYAEESRDVIVETSLSRKNNNETEIPHLTIYVSYLDTIKKKLVKDMPVTKSITRSDGMDISPNNTHVALQILRIQTTQVISDAEKLADSDQLDKAREKISEFTRNLQHEAGLLLGESNNQIILQFQVELNAILASLVSRSDYESVGSKMMTSVKTSWARQRCSAAIGKGESQSVPDHFYRSSKKQALAKKFKNMST